MKKDIEQNISSLQSQDCYERLRAFVWLSRHMSLEVTFALVVFMMTRTSARAFEAAGIIILYHPAQQVELAFEMLRKNLN